MGALLASPIVGVGVDDVLFVLTVYLRSSPEVCYQRLQKRGREEEKPVTLVSALIAQLRSLPLELTLPNQRTLAN